MSMPVIDFLRVVFFTESFQHVSWWKKEWSVDWEYVDLRI